MTEIVCGDREQLRRNRAGQAVLSQPQGLEPAELSQFCGNGAGQGVAVQTQLTQSDEVPQLGRNRTGETIGGQVQVDEAIQPAELRGNASVQPFPVQDELDHTFLGPPTVTPCHKPSGTAACQLSDASPASVSFTASSTVQSSSSAGLVGGSSGVQSSVLARSW